MAELPETSGCTEVYIYCNMCMSKIPVNINIFRFIISGKRNILPRASQRQNPNPDPENKTFEGSAGGSQVWQEPLGY